MSYQIGQKICLWQVKMEMGNPMIQILKEIMVRVTETKTGVPGEFSQQPSTGTSLRAVDENGVVYEKHWDFWPESQTNCFTGTWSLREDDIGPNNLWDPKEAVHFYNEAIRARKKNPDIRIVDPQGNKMVPKGDVNHCTEHDYYSHKGSACIKCTFKNRAA